MRNNFLNFALVATVSFLLLSNNSFGQTGYGPSKPAQKSKG